MYEYGLGEDNTILFHIWIKWLFSFSEMCVWERAISFVSLVLCESLDEMNQLRDTVCSWFSCYNCAIFLLVITIFLGIAMLWM
jgi:hypothetical protein